MPAEAKSTEDALLAPQEGQPTSTTAKLLRFKRPQPSRDDHSDLSTSGSSAGESDDESDLSDDENDRYDDSGGQRVTAASAALFVANTFPRSDSEGDLDEGLGDEDGPRPATPLASH